MKKKVIKIVLCSFLCLIAVLTVAIPLIKPNSRIATQKAYADSIQTDYSYTSSYFYLPINTFRFPNQEYYTYSLYADILSKVHLSSDTFSIDFNIFEYNEYEYRDTEDYDAPNYGKCAYYFKSQSINFSDINAGLWHTFYLPFNSPNDNRFVWWGYYLSSNLFNFNIRQIEYSGNILNGSSVSYRQGTGSNGSGLINVASNNIYFFDTSGNYFCVYFRSFPYLNINGEFEDFDIHPRMLDSRTYYLSGNLTDNEIYESGKNYGYQIGKSEGKDIGYNNGLQVGKNIGYNNGYNDGVADANTYSFPNLISSIIDVPVNTFTSLFHFDLLGIQLDGFLLGLLTLCIIITIVKMLL